MTHFKEELERPHLVKKSVKQWMKIQGDYLGINCNPYVRRANDSQGKE